MAITEAYLHCFRRDDLPRCLICPKKDVKLVDVTKKVKSNIVIMMQKESDWNLIKGFITNINKVLRREKQIRKERLAEL